MMVVAHNLMAQNANRQFGKISVAKGKSTEKLSSGYRINRAADDAAGLSISEKMRAQVRGLERASQNIQEGISFVQTADGYLNEVTSILQRMNELAVQASNDTNTETDRCHIDDEIQELKSETKRILKTADFNTLKIWQIPYSPEPELKAEGTEVTYVKTSTLLPDGVKVDDKSMESGKLANTYTTGGKTYHAATFIDFSGVDLSDLSKLDGKGFYSTCCTCDDHYSITFDSSTSENKVEGEEEHFTYTIGTQGVSSASQLVQKIVDATGGNAKSGRHPSGHYTNYAVSNTDASGSTLVLYDNRPNQTAKGSYGEFGSGVTIEKVTQNTEQDFQVFNRGIDSKGNPLFGGVEINDVRHTWEEMGIKLKGDGKTFDGDQEVEFYDYNYERICLKVKDGDEAPNISRNYVWEARTNGIYINNVLATDWDSLGIKDTGNGGEYSFSFRNMQLDFLVPNGSTKEDVMDGINAKVLDEKYSWDLNVGDTEVESAIKLSGTKTYDVTEANKNIVGNKYYIQADSTGITLMDSGGNTHTSVAWKDFVNADKVNASDPDYPISDWGITDVDGKSTKSDLVTFDDTATYTYTDTAHAELPVTFSFSLADEAGLATVINELNGAEFDSYVSAPHTLSSSVTSNATGMSVRVYRDNMDFETQRSYGRNFDDPNASFSGTVNSTFVKGTVIETSPRYYEPETSTPVVDASSIVSGTDSIVYVSDGNGGYYKATRSEQTWNQTSYRDAIDIVYNNANYKYSGNFAGNDIAEVNGDNFLLKTQTTTHQQLDETVRSVTYDVDTSHSFTEEDIAILSGVISTMDDDGNTVNTTSGWTDTSSETEMFTDPTSDRVTITTSKGTAMTLDFSYGENNTSDGATTIGFQATGHAERNFSVKPNGNNNKSVAGVVTDAEVIVPERELNIQSGALAWQAITLKWEGLNNTILGIASTHVRDYKHAQKAIDDVKGALDKVTMQRAYWGAMQNRLEHAYDVDKNTAENTDAAESRIRDTDMAKEMVNYSKHNILEQVGQSMIAQANQTQQGIMNILG